MPSVYIDFPPTELKFYCFDNDIDDKMSKKLNKLGLPDLQVEFPENKNKKLYQGDDGLYLRGEFSFESFPVSEATKDSTYNTTFNAEDNSITVFLEGRFFCHNTIDEPAPNQNQTIGYVWAIRINNDKGKIIKKPKDEYGMSSPIEALAEKENYEGGAHKVSFSIHIEREFYSE